MSAPTWTTWAIGGLVIPMPAAVPSSMDETPGDWMASQRVADFTGQLDALAAIARRWDAWVTAQGLRILDGLGPSPTCPAITRTIAGDDVAVSFGLMGMPGQAWHLHVTVARYSARPRVEIRDGCIHSHGLAIPVMPGATPGMHMDYTEFDAEDEHTIEVPGLTPTAMTAFYQRWAASIGLRAGEHDPGRPFLTFEDVDRGLDVSITCELPSSVLICVRSTQPDGND
ncbi:MAG: hypothetical protein M4D80_00040 [Myxococcota bacterium]|nr:hypothetical protein [Myxococcota bacterium]